MNCRHHHVHISPFVELENIRPKTPFEVGTHPVQSTVKDNELETHFVQNLVATLNCELITSKDIFVKLVPRQMHICALNSDTRV